MDIALFRLNSIHRMDTADNIKTRELGVLFQDLRVIGTGASISYQPTVGSILDFRSHLREIQEKRHPTTRDILTGFEGVVRPGEMLRELINFPSCIKLYSDRTTLRSSFY